MQTQLERDLIATRDRIARPENWTQGGKGWCAAGLFNPRMECISVAAMRFVGGGDGQDPRYTAVMVALASTFSDDELVAAERKYREGLFEEDIGVLPAWSLVIGFNDSHTHAELMAKCERAIGTEQARQNPPKPRILYDTTEAVAELRRKATAQVAFDEGGGAVAEVETVA